MPDHKNQHYVPRCYLRPFTIKAQGKAINLLNIKRQQIIRAAPLRNQCSKDYFYGTDLVLEKAFQSIEGSYSSILRKIVDQIQCDQDDLWNLTKFAYLQYLRTDMALKRVQYAQSEMKSIFEGFGEGRAPKIDISDYQMLAMCMNLFVKTVYCTKDLKRCIIYNSSVVDFITSDDPCVLTNKYHFQRLGTANFGVGSAGVILVLPLTPRAMLLAYDGDIYTTLGKSMNSIFVNKREDVSSLNQLQCLKAGENIYFSNWDSRELVRQTFDACADDRPLRWSKVSTYVKAQTSFEVDGYRRSTRAEHAASNEGLIAVSSYHPVLRAWPTFIRYRQPIRYYSNGSSAGHVRRFLWEEKFGSGDKSGLKKE